MADTRYVAFVQGPNGTIWENTCALYEGKDAEYKARQLAQDKFFGSITGGLIKGRPPYSFWDQARNSGFECICIELPKPSDGES